MATCNTFTNEPNPNPNPKAGKTTKIRGVIVYISQKSKRGAMCHHSGVYNDLVTVRGRRKSASLQDELAEISSR